MKKTRLAIIFGGFSNEKEISKITTDSIVRNLNKRKYNIVLFDLTKDIKIFLELAQKGEIDLVIPAVHGWGGEDGRLQGMLDLLGIKYVFSPYYAHAVAMNKKLTKLVAEKNGLTTLPDILIKKAGKINYVNIIKKIPFPIIIKPNNSGSSVGIKIAKNLRELKSAIKYGFRFDDELIIEKYVSGREFTVAIYKKKQVKTLPIIEIVPKISSWFDYKAKYAQGGSEEICPAKIPSSLAKDIKNQGIKIFEALGCKDLARADFIQDRKTGRIYFIEINTIPGMTPASLFPKALAAAGSSLGSYFDDIIKQNINNVRTNKKS
ncbi:MAG TPA: D-alanine--D-alanine ligase [bacterium]|mgnify:CR=1 FL=1|nr:D-alanine--D-alanine ligase [bacterium]